MTQRDGQSGNGEDTNHDCEKTETIITDRGGTEPQLLQQPNRREREIRRLRGKITTLHKLFKTSSPAEKDGIKDLTGKLRENPTKKEEREGARSLLRNHIASRGHFLANKNLVHSAA